MAMLAFGCAAGCVQRTSRRRTGNFPPISPARWPRLIAHGTRAAARLKSFVVEREIVRHWRDGAVPGGVATLGA